MPHSKTERDEIGRANEKEMGGRVIRRQPKLSSENKEIETGCGQSFKHNEKLTCMFHSLDMFLYQPAGTASCLKEERVLKV